MKIIPQPPEIINGIPHARANFVFTSADILKPLDPALKDHPVILELLARIEADVIESLPSLDP